MNKSVKLVATCALALTMLAPLGGTALAAPKAAPKASAKVKYPMTFVCVHCHNKITIKSKAALTKTCTACKCGMPMKDCRMPAK